MRLLVRLLWVVFALSLHAVATADGDSPATPSPQTAVVPSTSPASVWVNTRSKIYHYPGSRWYGGTESGKYVSEADAIAEGDRAAMNEHRPLSYGVPVAREAVASSALAGPPAAPAAFLPIPAVPTPLLPASAAKRLAPAPEPPAPPVPSGLLSMQPAAPVSTCLTAIAAQSDPAKLATLGERGTNRRLKRIMYYLAQARAGGADPGELIDQAQGINDSTGTPRAPLVKASLLRNLKICDGLGLLTPENLWRLRHGTAPVVTRGPYVGQNAEVDHIVPRSVSLETDNELANLEMLPAALNRAKAAKVGDRQLALARKFREAGMITDATMARIEARYRPAGTEKYELQEEYGWK